MQKHKIMDTKRDEKGTQKAKKWTNKYAKQRCQKGHATHFFHAPCFPSHSYHFMYCSRILTSVGILTYDLLIISLWNY